MSDRKLIIFDFDGTLIEFSTIFDLALVEFSQSRNLPWDAKKLALGYVDPYQYDLGWGVALHEQPLLLEEFNIFTTAQLGHDPRYMPRLFDDTKQSLHELKDSFDFGIVTARDRASLLAILDHYQLSGLFPNYRSLCCARDRGYLVKPKPDALHCLLKDTGHTLENTVMIGDTTADIGMANAAGVKSIAVLWGVHPVEKLQSAEPTMMLERMVDLPDAVKQIFDQRG